MKRAFITALAVAGIAAAAPSPAHAAGSDFRFCADFKRSSVTYSVGVKRATCAIAMPVGRKMARIPADRASFKVKGRRWHWVRRTDGFDRVARSGKARVVLSVQGQA